MTHMSRDEFHSLSSRKQAQWARRLRDQWDTSLDDAAEFWYDGNRIVGVRRYLKNEEGGRYLIGRNAADEILGEVLP